MKRILLVLWGLCCMHLVAQDIDLSASKANFTILQRSASSMDIRFTLPDYEISEISAAGLNYQKISVPGAQSFQDLGMPELPMLSTSIAIPVQGGFSLEVLSANQRVLSGINAYPLQDASLPISSRSFIKNQGFYNSTQSYPQQDIIYSDPMILRELRIVNISISPFVYDAASQELRIRESMEIRLTFNSESAANELATAPQYLSAAFTKTYESMILNFDDYRDLVLANTPPRYLIIHGQSSDTTFLNALDSYVLWKRQKGANVDIATTSNAEAGSSTSSIQSYIRNRYNNPATRPDFVILVGDTSGSFAVPAHSYSGGGTDYPYTFMNTGDMLGDVFIGRISVENTSQFLVLLNKIYLYERDLNLDTAGWLNHMLLVGDNNPSGISTLYISKYIKELAQEVNPDYSFTEQYGSDFNSFVPAINAAFNQGIGFYSFRGYIDFSPPSESSLFNSYKLPHAIIITCSTGNYSGGTAETESLIRYGSTAVPKGAVTAIGMSTSSTHTTFNNVLHGGIFDGIFTYGMRTMGEAMLHGKLYMDQIFGVSSPDNVGKFTHWCNLMGDPTLEVFTGIPSSFQISTDANIPLGLSLLDINVKDAALQPVESASVVLSLGSNILARGYSDAEGNVILILPSNMSVGNAILTISKANFKPLIHSIPIANIATLVPGNVIIDDSATGNNDAVITAGETVELYFGLRNTGSTALTRISGMMHTDSPWVEIIQGTVVYPPIAGAASVLNNNPLVIKIAPHTPHGTMLRLHLTLREGFGSTYNVSEFIPVEAARAIFTSYQVLDGATGVLDAGESAQLKVGVKNTGAAAVQNIYGLLTSSNDLLEVSSNTAYFGALPLNAIVNTSGSHFQVFCREPTLPGMIMPLNLRLYNADGFEQNIPFSLSVGTVTQQNPLGPDGYGYVIYDWTDTAYPEAPVYNWVEIAPQLGGLGTALPISDPHTSTEGDQVGAQSLAMVSLPFAFQFYGRLYDQITVCSNGFIALGETGNAEFRNFRLPGAMGPSPMIAAFWDDLATRNGSSISYWFDRANRRFIVEWYNLVNGKNGSTPETFQIILYDQNYYYTSLGDGPIKIQYHTFNNINSQSGAQHGNFCTIGIEDHSGTRGLEYTFNNIYPIAAAPLSSGKAIYITNNPSMYDAPIATNTFAALALRQGDELLLRDLNSHFYSSAYLSYSLVEHAQISASTIEGGLRLSLDPAFYGITQIGIQASDPMGRHIEQYFTLTVEEAIGHKQSFINTSIPPGWGVGNLGSTTQTWHIAANDRDNYFAQCSATPGHTANERLSTNGYNLSGYQDTKVRFWMDFKPVGSSSSVLQFSFNNISWTGIDVYAGAYTGYKEYVLPVLDGQRSVRLRWTYVSGVNSAGLENYWKMDDLTITGLITDSTAPTLVSNLNLISAQDGVLNLSWSPSYDAFFSHYELYLASGNSVSLADTRYSVEYDASLGLMATNQISISGLANGLYTLAIRALDLSGNASGLSAELRIVLGSFPAEAQNLRITTQGADIILNWDAVNTDLLGNPISITGYRIYAAELPDFTPSEASLILESSSPTAILSPVANSHLRRFFRVTAIAE